MLDQVVLLSLVLVLEVLVGGLALLHTILLQNGHTALGLGDILAIELRGLQPDFLPFLLTGPLHADLASAGVSAFVLF